MAKTTRDIYENAWKWANMQRMELGKKRDALREKAKITKKEIKEVEFAIATIDDVIKTLEELKNNGGVID